MTRTEPISPVPGFLWLLVGVMVAIEAAKHAAIAGWLPIAPVEFLYARLMFFDPAFDHALATGQGWGDVLPRLVGHGLLHSGWLHVLMNSAALLGFGNMVSRGAGVRAFVVIFFVSVIAGGLAFGLLAETKVPMVGASGGVFGLLGVFIVWQGQMAMAAGQSLVPVWRQVGGLLLLNVILWFAFRGLLAWEAHLGGFLAGAALAQVYRLR